VPSCCLSIGYKRKKLDPEKRACRRFILGLSAAQKLAAYFNRNSIDGFKLPRYRFSRWSNGWNTMTGIPCLGFPRFPRTSQPAVVRHKLVHGENCTSNVRNPTSYVKNLTSTVACTRLYPSTKSGPEICHHAGATSRQSLESTRSWKKFSTIPCAPVFNRRCVELPIIGAY
jgi:hypothetical protein